MEDGEERSDEPSACGNVVTQIAENAMESTHVKLRLIYKQQNLRKGRERVNSERRNKTWQRKEREGEGKSEGKGKGKGSCV